MFGLIHRLSPTIIEGISELSALQRRIIYSMQPLTNEGPQGVSDVTVIPQR